jgi:hypothetical protein
MSTVYFISPTLPPYAALQAASDCLEGVRYLVQFDQADPNVALQLERYQDLFQQLYDFIMQPRLPRGELPSWVGTALAYTVEKPGRVERTRTDSVGMW